MKLFTKIYGGDLDLVKEDIYVEIHFYMSAKKKKHTVKVDKLL